MSASQQAKSRRNQMANNYAHLGNSLKKPRYSIKSRKSIAEAIKLERIKAAREARAKSGRKNKK